jgi:mannitol/fructose-specific phosphotransferase system IIA component
MKENRGDKKKRENMESIDEKIGEGLIRIGAMNKEQVDNVLERQEKGDTRLFGEIAVELGFVDVDAIIKYLQSKNKEVT